MWGEQRPRAAERSVTGAELRRSRRPAAVAPAGSGAVSPDPALPVAVEVELSIRMRWPEAICRAWPRSGWSRKLRYYAPPTRRACGFPCRFGCARPRPHSRAVLTEVVKAAPDVRFAAWLAGPWPRAGEAASSVFDAGAGEAAVRHGVRCPPRRDAGVDRRERLTSRRRLAAGSARDAAPPTTGQAVARGRAAPEEEKWMRVGLGRAGRCDSTRESKSSGHGPDPVAVPSPAHRASAELALGRPSRSWRRGERHSSRDGVRRLRGHARDVPAHRRQRPAWTFRLAMSALRRRGPLIKR